MTFLSLLPSIYKSDLSVNHIILISYTTNKFLVQHLRNDILKKITPPNYPNKIHKIYI